MRCHLELGRQRRQLQVFGLLSNKEVAAHLGLSEETVYTYKARLMTKLGVSTTPELLARFREGKSSRAGRDVGGVPRCWLEGAIANPGFA